MRLRILILILCFLGGFMSCAEEVFTDYGTRISFKKYSKDYFAIRRFIIRLEKNIAKLLRQHVDDPSGAQLTISLTEAGTEFSTSFSKSRIDVYLSVRFQDWDNDYEVLRRLVCCFYAVRCKVPVKSEAELLKAIPYWIQLGTLEYVRNRTTQSYSGFRYYPLLHNAELAGVEPDPDDIINSKVIKSDGVLFYYYLELCEIMLDWVCHLSSYKFTLLQDMIVKTAGGMTPVEAFYTVGMKRMLRKASENLRSNKELSDRDKVRKLFRYVFRKEVVNGFMPIPADQSLAKLKKLLTVRYEYKEKDGEIIEKSCQLYELGEVWGQVNNRKAVLTGLREKLNVLERESAQEFIRPANIMIDSMNSLPAIKNNDVKNKNADKKSIKDDKSLKPPEELKVKGGNPQKGKKELFDPAEFRRNIMSAISCFEDIVKQRRQIEVYLDKSATKFIPVRERYKCLFGTFDVIDENDRKIRPDLNKYLDQVEKEYIED